MKRNALFRIILWSIVLAILTSMMVGELVFSAYFRRGNSRAERNPETTITTNVQGQLTFPASSVRELDIE